jgi:hypothetical protein
MFERLRMSEEEKVKITYGDVADLSLTFDPINRYIACFLTGGLVVSGSLGFLLFLIWLASVGLVCIAAYERKKEEDNDR